MAALFGFDSFVAAAETLPPYTLAEVLVSVGIPGKATIGGIDVAVDDLDGSVAPLMRIDVGDAVDPNRFIAADDITMDGGLLEWRPLPTEYYRYSLATDVRVTVQAVPASAVAGAIAITVYAYPSLDIADVQRMVLQALGVLADGETPRAQDAVLALEALTEVHEGLRFKSLANRQDLAWPVTLIPAFAGRPYARLAANLLADTFGIPGQRAQVLAQRAVEAEREMRRQTQTKTTGQPVSLEPYQTPPPFILDLGVLA